MLISNANTILFSIICYELGQKFAQSKTKCYNRAYNIEGDFYGFMANLDNCRCGIFYN